MGKDGIRMAFKTNVMRILDREKLPYRSYDYEDTGAISGVDVAKTLELNPSQMFKTLVTVGKSGKYYVFLLPVDKELDLKRAGDSVGEKSISMIKSKDLLGLTGYIHGGCSPIGMKKTFTTIIDESSREFDTIIFNAGKIGYQVELSLTDLEKIIKFELKDKTK